MNTSEKCDCVICKNNNKFVMPEDIINAVEKKELVLFCGAGISTESKIILPQTFYMSIGVCQVSCRIFL